MLSPPLDLAPKWFAGHVAYSIAKYGMSLAVLGLAEELKADGIAVNALWPRTTIATAAVRNILGGDKLVRMSRIARDRGGRRAPRAVAEREALHRALPDRRQLLYEVGGVRDFANYSVDPAMPLAPDFFVPADSTPPPGVTLARVGMLP